MVIKIESFGIKISNYSNLTYKLDTDPYTCEGLIYNWATTEVYWRNDSLIIFY